jgi:hypothetical protein
MGLFSFLFKKRWSPPKIEEVVKLSDNPLEGKPLRYLIGAEGYINGVDGEITEVPYDHPKPPFGLGIAYCNLFDEYNTGQYGPYLRTSDTAAQYSEGQINPIGRGWVNNIHYQLSKRTAFRWIEWDNCDAYSVMDVLKVYDLSARAGFRIIAKNPYLCGEYAWQLLAHPAVDGAIVEKGAGAANMMHTMRTYVGKPNLPVWFVAFGDDYDLRWARSIAVNITAAHLINMGVTYSSQGEYGNSEDILRPIS